MEEMVSITASNGHRLKASFRVAKGTTLPHIKERIVSEMRSRNARGVWSVERVLIFITGAGYKTSLPEDYRVDKDESLVFLLDTRLNRKRMQAALEQETAPAKKQMVAPEDVAPKYKDLSDSEKKVMELLLGELIERELASEREYDLASRFLGYYTQHQKSVKALKQTRDAVELLRTRLAD